MSQISSDEKNAIGATKDAPAQLPEYVTVYSYLGGVAVKFPDQKYEVLTLPPSYDIITGLGAKNPKGKAIQDWLRSHGLTQNDPTGKIWWNLVEDLKVGWEGEFNLPVKERKVIQVK